MNINDIKDKNKTLLQLWRERDPITTSLTIQFNDDTRVYIEQNRHSYIYVIPKAFGEIVLAIKFRVPESYTIAQCASIATALQELARNPLAVCAVINEFLKPGANTEVDNEEPVPPTVRTGHSHAE